MRNTSLTNMVGAACFAAMTLTACGGGTGGRDIIAHVGTREISKSSLEHLISIEAITDYEEFPNPTIPTSLVPEPPRYTGCVAHLQRIAPTAAIKHRGFELARVLIRLAHLHRWWCRPLLLV